MEVETTPDVGVVTTVDRCRNRYEIDRGAMLRLIFWSRVFTSPFISPFASPFTSPRFPMEWGVGVHRRQGQKGFRRRHTQRRPNE